MKIVSCLLSLLKKISPSMSSQMKLEYVHMNKMFSFINVVFNSWFWLLTGHKPESPERKSTVRVS